MARTNEEWAALLGSTLCKMARVYGTDAPNAYLPEECYPVIEKTFEVALKDARAEGYAAALRDLQQNRIARAAKKQRLTVIGQVMRALPLARRTA
ncbi:hypothetical protein GR158_11765 [Shinella sp. AETb1-6]|jgi:hypothetical protein|uniref:Uncharacterized protein n=1 Tax=Shinella sumterensis TaxID=1967501 RepID=A0AA50H6M3_9HYPH|nr:MULTISPECIES: hypothetical protein [Shinella]MDP9591863.1 hypothetical protein [Shinella zoogloeoides]MCD1264207.1 hypothetical protein [Shinella sumterensis]MXN51797.1 hypothetical protein [Shinella sp. AETb1-6]TFE97679.1 hypothetical protein B5M44_13805 [Shinella sumterensis]WLR95854.1 hypothetical protein Q9313_08840 [Shinella sumterensis]